MPPLQGYAKECILEPSLVRLAPEEIDRAAIQPPHVRAVSKAEKTEVVCKLWEYDFLGVVGDDKAWQLDRHEVENGLFGIAKAGAPVACTDGKSRPQLRKSMHMVATHALQRAIPGKIECFLPAEAAVGRICLWTPS